MPLASPRTGLISLAAFALFSASIHADTLQLANGDRLQGKLLSREAGTIRWENPVLGILTMTESQGTVIADSPGLPTSSSQAAAGSGSAGSPPTPTAKQSTGSPPSAAKPEWKTTLESGLTLQSGRSDRADINLRAESTYQRRRNTFRTQAKYLYSKADGSVTTDRTEAAFRWRRELDAHWFGQTNTSYLSARIKGIDHSIEQNVGLGYRLIKTERTQASIGAGVTGQYREIADTDTGHSLFGEVFQDFAIKLTPRLDLGEDFTVMYAPSSRGIRILNNGTVQIIDADVANYKHTLNAFFRGKLTDTLSVAIRYEYEFDNTYVSESEKADQRITTTLGYTF